jgi:TolB-like protein
MKTLSITSVTIIAAAALLFSGCYQKVVSHGSSKYEKCAIDNKHYNLDNSRVNYQALTNEAVDTVFNDVEDIPEQIVVTEFVDLTSLENQSKFGYVLSNSIKNSLINDLETEVIEAEVGKYFKISENGLKVLSRDIKKIRTDNLNVKHAVVGTYTHTHSETVVFVKLVNLEDGIIEGSYSKTLPMNCAMLRLLNEK